MRNVGMWRAKIGYVAALLLLAAIASIVYALQLQHTNAYMGFLPADVRLSRVLVSVAICVALGLSLPAKIEKPSHLFLILNAFFVVLSYAFFGAAAYEAPLGSLFFWTFLLAIPHSVVALLSYAKWTLHIDFDLKKETVLLIAIGVVGAGVAFAVMNAGSTAGFSIADAYDRRMSGRDIFQAGSAMAYLNVMTMNGINPFLAFLGGFLNRKLLALLAIVFSLAFFYSIGVKAPIAFAGLAYAVGIGVRTQNMSIFVKAIVALTGALFLVFMVEFSAFGYSEVAEYFFRRIFVIPGFDIQHYMQLLFESGEAVWSPFWGISSDLSPTYLVGATFFGNVEANVNTNSFTYALAAGGFVGFFATILLVAAFFKTLDALYAASANAGYLYIAFLYSILLTEQSALTALASSGVGLLFCLVVLSGKGWSARAASDRRNGRVEAQAV